MSFDNLLVWCLLLLGLGIYQRIAFLILRLQTGLDGCDKGWCEALGKAVAALPLLGLLGTIMGLLDSFAAMARGEGLEGGMAAGIADALWTTQLGLMLALPAWLLLGYLKRLSLNLEREQANARQSSAAA
ncbi:MotA/TolQ/ExbB proton channel family protein [Shewanella sp. JM162201]|uniref:MotA/TolQ/ExbB proton channel family protein n=1 Tax=Shewanella jiangmenensis TaxID=2837387 RepID=A0ABS5V298_9GAMM|nr:MotA/TolQ/ExbB proton channel family protein [Shewanella jiangmenensis]MBT1443779.1 MotA/TolQ/ExbB proton channel family protein [Shewanella jiangmenensis]